MCCNKNYKHEFYKKLNERFFNTYKFSNHDSNKLILFLQKDIYLYEYMDDWEKLHKLLLPKKDEYFSHLNIEDIDY